MSDAAVIDVAAIEADVQGMSVEELKEFVLKTRTRAKVVQKKYGYNPERAKLQRMRAAEKQRKAVELLKAQPSPDGKGSLYDFVERQATANAQAELDSAPDADSDDE